MAFGTCHRRLTPATRLHHRPKEPGRVLQIRRHRGVWPEELTLTRCSPLSACPSTLTASMKRISGTTSVWPSSRRKA
eukprot:8687688-Karenia_brevis.AAC.1